MAYVGGGTVAGAIRLRQPTVAPGVSAANEGRIYFDETTGKFKVSEDGGAYVDLVGGGGGGGSLSDVLAVGNTTGANDIVISTDQKITSEALLEIAAFSGESPGELTLWSGSATGAEPADAANANLFAGDAAEEGNGGTVVIAAGYGGSTSGSGGDVVIDAGDWLNEGSSGSIYVGTGISDSVWIKEFLFTENRDTDQYEISGPGWTPMSLGVRQAEDEDTAGSNLMLHAGMALGAGAGGDLELYAGLPDTNGAGGDILLHASSGTVGQAGGNILGWAGYGGVGGIAGRVEFVGGEGDDASAGGEAILRGGPANGNGAAAGRAYLIGGKYTTADNDESGADAVVSGGDGSGVNAIAGNVVLRGGLGHSGAEPGQVLIGTDINYTTAIVVGDPNWPGDQDMVVHANLVAGTISGPNGVQIGDSSDPMSGLVLVRKGYMSLGEGSVAYGIEFGPVYYDTKNGNYVQFGPNSIYVDGDSNLIRSTDGDDVRNVYPHSSTTGGDTYDLADAGAIDAAPLEPGAVTVRVILEDDPSQFSEVTDDGAGTFAASDVLPAGGTVNYAARTLTGVTAALSGGSRVEIAYKVANGVGGQITLRAGDASGTASGGDLTIRSGAGGTTSGDSGDLTIDVGAVTSGTAGTVSVGSTNASAVAIGKAGATTTVSGSFVANGSVVLGAVVTVSGNTTLDAANAIILVDASGGPVTITLPAAAAATGRHYTIKKVDSSANAVTIDGDGAEMIDGATTQSLAVQYDSLEVVSNGTAWFIV